MFEISSRKEAISKAIKNINSGEVLLFAGKGHENYQEYRKEYEALKPHVVEALGYSGSHYVALALEALMHDVKDDVLKGKDWNKDR